MVLEGIREGRYDFLVGLLIFPAGFGDISEEEHLLPPGPNAVVLKLVEDGKRRITTCEDFVQLPFEPKVGNALLELVNREFLVELLCGEGTPSMSEATSRRSLVIML